MLRLIVVAASDDSGQGAPPRNRSLRDQLVEELRHRYDRDYEVMGSDIVDNGFRYSRDEVIEWRDKGWKRDQFHASWLSNTGHRWQPRWTLTHRVRP